MVDDEQIRRAASKLQERIGLTLGDLADEILGRPAIGSPEWRQEWETRETEAGRERLREWHLLKIRICRAADVSPTGDVLNARKQGATWQQIADACGMTRQAAHDRWAKYEGAGDDMTGDELTAWLERGHVRGKCFILGCNGEIEGQPVLLRDESSYGACEAHGSAILRVLAEQAVSSHRESRNS